jgi:hypothetical protein
MEKKLIAFEDNQIEAINEWAEQYKKTFTEAVRKLVDIGLNGGEEPIEPDSTDLINEVAALRKQVEDLSWWTADDNTSNLHNLGVKLEEMQKHINVLTAASKLFKGHIKNREIHLQD